jgi:hypothetical protein
MIEDIQEAHSKLSTFDAVALAENVWQAIHTASPNYLDREGKDSKTEHPIFYGCYDWHSAVHSHCTLLILLDMITSNQSHSVDEIEVIY